jgi:hypothetical protein
MLRELLPIAQGGIFFMMSRKDLPPYSQIEGDKVFCPEGRWQNELGSTMVIDPFDGTNFSGLIRVRSVPMVNHLLYRAD